MSARTNGSIISGVVSDKLFKGHRSPVAMGLYFMTALGCTVAALLLLLAVFGQVLAPFSASGAKSWSAETRGSNLVLLANNSPSAKFSLGQLSVVLCHELFHAWVPNALSLDGNYDWFFEGFTLYQALCGAVRLGLIDFQEYLDTLGRVYDSYLLARESGDLSLLEASR